MDTTVIEALPDWLPLVLQTSDSIFPSGAYAHSLGLEEFARTEIVRDEQSLLRLLENHILPSLEHTDLPLVREAHAAARDTDLAALIAADTLAGALKLPRELRNASLQTGRRRLATLVRVRPTPILVSLQEAAENSEAVGHHAVVWAAACSSAPVGIAVGAYFYQCIAGLCSAAPKLLRIGPEAAQRVLTACLDQSSKIVDRALQIPAGEIGWFDPALDLASMHHEISNERLFIS